MQRKSFKMIVLFSLLFAFASTAFAVPFELDVTSVTSSLTYTGGSLTGITINATILPVGGWVIPSLSVWAFDGGMWTALSDSTRNTFALEDLGNNQYQMQADDLGFMGWWPLHDTNHSDPNGQYQDEWMWKDLNEVMIPQGFWFGYDDPATIDEFPFYQVFANGFCDEHEGWEGPEINPLSPITPSWEFGVSYGVQPPPPGGGGGAIPEPGTMILLGSGLVSLAGYRKRSA